MAMGKEIFGKEFKDTSKCINPRTKEKRLCFGRKNSNHRRVLHIKQKEATMKKEVGGSDNRSQELSVKEDTRHLNNQPVPGTIAIRKGSVCFQCEKKREKIFMLSVKSQIKFR